MFHHVDFNIYGSTIRVQSKHLEALAVLRLEFRYFICSDISRTDFLLTLHPFAAPAGLLPELVARRISQNSLTYDEGSRRWNDYFGKALSVYDYDSREGLIYCADQDLLHEIAYLMVLSLTGKSLDQRGFHKIHACGFRYKGRDVIVMLPSKGGKTTLFLELSRFPGVELLSDDTPLIDHLGHVHPFPLRLGVEKIPPHLQQSSSEFTLFKRQHFSDKWLIPLDKLGAPIAASSGQHVVLVQGFRTSHYHTHFAPMGTIAAFKSLAEHMIVGIGLPMVLEYFIKNTWRDWLTLFKIGFARTYAALKLWQNGEAWAFSMGQDPKENAAQLIKKLDQL